MAAVNDFNAKIMEEFHANAGKVGGRFAGIDLLILTTTGRKSGQMRWHPVAYSTDGDRYVIVAQRAARRRARTGTTTWWQMALPSSRWAAMSFPSRRPSPLAPSASASTPSTPPSCRSSTSTRRTPRARSRS